jgi:L-ribulose-5-phosphate 3-epimerase
MTTISFIGANYVARELGYHMTGGWGQGDRATQERFRPIESFAERFEELLEEIVAMGFDSVDIWTSHLHPAWATDEHIATARDLLGKYGLRVVSLAGWFGGTAEELERSCQLATGLGCRILGGSTSLLEKDRAGTVAILKRHDVALGLENHPEKTPDELLAKIGDGRDGHIGACVDTGWFGTQGYDAAKALEELQDVLVHVHLKDVLAVSAHDTCGFGRGVVPIRACVETLQRIGYKGAIGIEHEPEDRDPRPEIAESFALLKEWAHAGAES